MVEAGYDRGLGSGVLPKQPIIVPHIFKSMRLVSWYSQLVIKLDPHHDPKILSASEGGISGH